MNKTKRFFPFFFCFISVPVALAQVSPHGPMKFACRNCHAPDSTQTRKDSSFDHGLTGFALNERHGKIICSSCHKLVNFSLQQTTCVSCHPDVHKGELGQTCARCHVTQAWVGAEMMRQHEKGRFLLTGAHEAVPCKLCHVDKNFKLAFRDCRQCHEGEKAKIPDHTTATFTDDCVRCHSTKGWRPSTFDHSTTRFSRTGAHAKAACQSCHVNNNYLLQYVNCFQCHEALFTQSLSPNHVVANFPHDCYPCHSTTAWRPSTFTHDQENFAIFNGRHRNRWSACSDCHQNPANFASFSCLSCHEEGPTSQSHINRSGYSYASPACYTCHRDA